MKIKLIFLSILLTIGLLFTIRSGADTSPKLMSSPNQAGSVQEISFPRQATAEPPIDIPTFPPLPTIVINPTPGPGGGSFGQINYLTILVFVLVGAVILIALIAVLRK